MLGWRERMEGEGEDMRRSGDWFKGGVTYCSVLCVTVRVSCTRYGGHVLEGGKGGQVCGNV